MLFIEDGKEKDTIEKIRKLEMVEEANLYYFGEDELIGLVKINTDTNLSEREIKEFIKKNIRNLDAVCSTATLICKSDGDLQKEAELLKEEFEDEDDWEKGSKKDFAPNED